MTATPTGAFPQTPGLVTAVCTAANVTLTDAPDNTVLLLQAGADGDRVPTIWAIPRATVAGAMVGYLYASTDGGTTKRLIDAIPIPADTVSTSDAPAKSEFDYSFDKPLELAAAEELYVGISTALASGVVFAATRGKY